MQLKTRIRIFLYFCIVAIAAATLISKPYLLTEIRLKHIESYWILVGPFIFSFLFLVFCVDEIFIRGRKKDHHKIAFIPIAFGALLLVSLLPTSLQEYKTRESSPIGSFSFHNELFHSKDARVRALVVISSSCSLHSDKEWTNLMEKALADQDPLVRQAAIQQISLRFATDLTLDEEGRQQASSLLAKHKEE